LTDFVDCMPFKLILP